MKLDLNGEQYVIKFEHDVQDKWTTATLYKVAGELQPDDGAVSRDGKLALQEPPIFIGEAFCHYKDQYTKKTGRKVALSRLLAWMTKNRFELTREDRAEIWNKYFETHKK